MIAGLTRNLTPPPRRSMTLISRHPTAALKRARMKALTICLAFLLSALGLLTPFSAKAEDKKKDENIVGSFFFYLENDLFTGTDQHYTNGIKIVLLSADLDDFTRCRFLPSAVGGFLNKLPLFNRPGYKKNVGLSVGQNMYTPENIKTNTPDKHDRPYAGLSYIAGFLQSKSRHQLDIVELDIAVVGPSSLAGDVQKLIHRITWSQKPRGWHSQLKNEIGFAFSWQHRWRVLSLTTPSGLGMDLLPHIGFTAGTLTVMGNVGSSLRFGYQLPLDFGPSLILPGNAVSPPTGQVGSLEKNNNFSFSVFATADALAVAWSMLLEGNTYSRNTNIKKEPLVGNLGLGASIGYRSFILTYTLVLRTKEFKEQKKGQDYGSITLGFSF